MTCVNSILSSFCFLLGTKTKYQANTIRFLGYTSLTLSSFISLKEITNKNSIHTFPLLKNIHFELFPVADLIDGLTIFPLANKLMSGKYWKQSFSKKIGVALLTISVASRGLLILEQHKMINLSSITPIKSMTQVSQIAFIFSTIAMSHFFLGINALQQKKSWKTTAHHILKFIAFSHLALGKSPLNPLYSFSFGFGLYNVLDKRKDEHSRTST